MSNLKVGDSVSAFSLPANDNKTINLNDYIGNKNIVLYFYPKDDTPGCTMEAKDFAENIEAFNNNNTVVIGVSKDSISKHDKFIEKYSLPFDLISDEELQLCKEFNTWVEKSMYGRKYMGIERATFLINREGKIVQIWRKVKVKGHVQEILENISSKC